MAVFDFIEVWCKSIVTTSGSRGCIALREAHDYLMLCLAIRSRICLSDPGHEPPAILMNENTERCLGGGHRGS